MTLLYLMKNHSEVLSFFQTFYNEINNQFGMSVQTLQTDNVKEFLNLSLMSYLILDLVTKPLILILHNRTG